MRVMVDSDGDGVTPAVFPMNGEDGGDVVNSAAEAVAIVGK